MKKLLIILIIGLGIRFFLTGNTGFIADVAFWKSWGLAAHDFGVTWTAHNTNINYPPGIIYVLWFVTKIYALFANPQSYYEFWRENNFAFLFFSKSIAIFSDVIIAVLIYIFASNAKKLHSLGAPLNYIPGKIPLLLAALFFFNPVVIIDSALWGQVESFGMIFTLFALILIFYKKPLPAAAFFMVGILMKLQNIIYAPLFYVFIARYFDFKTLGKAVGISVLTFFVVCLPFVINKDLYQVLYLMTVNNDYFPYLSLNATNLWWIVAKAKGMGVSDKITVFGILNAKTVGLFLFSSMYLLCTGLIVKKPKPKNILLSLSCGIFAFFLFMTESHERYSYPLIVLLLFLYPFLSVKKSKTETQNIDSSSSILNIIKSNPYFFIIYVIFTILIFFNIHTGLILNYPHNGIGLLTYLTTPNLTIFASYLMVISFFLFIPYFLQEVGILTFIIPIVFLTLTMIFSHLSYFTKGKVSLTSFKPIYRTQGYASTEINRSANSYTGWKSWSRLGVDYMYYRNGIGTHAYSELVFDINRMFSKFSTDMGVDTEAGTNASVNFKILGDDKLLFESGKMGRFDFPKHSEVNINGVKYLKLIIDDAGDGIRDDHADWLNPVLIK